MKDLTAFVLGGGGHLGAHEVGMLSALVDFGIEPDLIIGTSIGAVNGAVFAADPSKAGVEKLAHLWTGLQASDVLSGSMFAKVKTLARTRTHVGDDRLLRTLLGEVLPVARVEDLAVTFECVAASIELATVHYFSKGPLVDAIMASAAVPGLLPPVEIDNVHYLDGGLVASIPLDRAIDLGASTIYVLQVGRIEAPLVAPSNPWEVAMVAFEISRRHRFSEALRSLPAGLDVHVLPTGDPKSFNDLRQYRTGDADTVAQRIAQSRRASLDYLDGLPR